MTQNSQNSSFGLHFLAYPVQRGLLFPQGYHTHVRRPLRTVLSIECSHFKRQDCKRLVRVMSLMRNVGTGVGLSGKEALNLQFCQEGICTGQYWFPGASEKGRLCWLAVNGSWTQKVQMDICNTKITGLW